MRKILNIGATGALIIVCDTESKFEVVSAYGYDKENEYWAQGHYFTLWGKSTEREKEQCIGQARRHFNKNYK